MDIKLTEMEEFFLNKINESDREELSPNYLAVLWYDLKGRRKGSSRDSFGQTSAAYRTCRKLSWNNLIKKNIHKTAGGYTYETYSKNN